MAMGPLEGDPAPVFARVAELCRALRSSDQIQHVYVIMMTANDQSEDLVTALDAVPAEALPV